MVGKRIRYYTMNNWNRATAPAYNLKVYNVIPAKHQDTIYEMMDLEDFWDDINYLIQNFDETNNHEWQAGFNGRSGGYLVLYRGGVHDNGQRYVKPGLSIEPKDVPGHVLRAFRQLAVDIVNTAIYMAKHCKIVEKQITIKKTIKTLENFFGEK